MHEDAWTVQRVLWGLFILTTAIDVHAFTPPATLCSRGILPIAGLTHDFGCRNLGKGLERGIVGLCMKKEETSGRKSKAPRSRKARAERREAGGFILDPKGGPVSVCMQLCLNSCLYMNG